ncbi:CocE/NonD family hydrolase [Janthinobacterium sp. 17J80-10]|uniref:dienelactone hydrolase family protein n=1 Tax=Janthinobacterium sp. 17J80-10 TaxID=2497863 RepID=UPI001F50BD24|nr:CocE/NonD family hydrolase [Janthinobacterium sp. 17J80-10]
MLRLPKVSRLFTPRRLAVTLAFAALPAIGLIANGCIAQSAATLDQDLNEKIVMIPAQSRSMPWSSKQVKSSGGDVAGSGGKVAEAARPRGWNGELETTIFMPPGEGPFPLLVLNHGKALGDPRAQERARFLAISREFVKRGYVVVIPMRSGFSKSSGDYVEQHCDMTANGQIQANDLHDVLAYAVRQPWVDPDRILVGGQSYGGLTAMAFATHGFPGVKGVLNFAGGLRTQGCPWQASLVRAFGSFGSQSRVPSLWFYGENDSYFNHELADRMHQAYTDAGGKATLVKFGAFKHDAHGMSGSRDGVRIWWPETEKFLRRIGMPTEEIFKIAEPAALPHSGFAALDDAGAVPYLREQGREQYRTFLSKSQPRAFALSPSGAWSWVEDGDDPAARALSNCQKNSAQPCKLYAIDDKVVWTDKT